MFLVRVDWESQVKNWMPRKTSFYLLTVFVAPYFFIPENLFEFYSAANANLFVGVAEHRGSIISVSRCFCAFFDSRQPLDSNHVTSWVTFCCSISTIIMKSVFFSTVACV